MKLLAFVSTFFLFQAAFAQFPVSPNLFDENGKRTGHWTILYDSNFYEVHDPDSAQFYRLIRFNAGVPDGKIRDFARSGHKYWDGYAKAIDPYVFDGESNHYHENGKLSYRQMYVDGKREGPCAEFYPNGTRKSTGQFHDDMQEGHWQYFHEDGSLWIDQNMSKNKRVGVVKYYHTNGKLESEGLWVDGFLNGTYREFYEDGTRSIVAHYKKDTLEGLYESFHENGSIDGRSEYKKGKREGISTYYYPGGAVKSKGPYKNGLQNGNWEFFHENGKKSSTGKVLNDNLEGEWKNWYDNGVLWKVSNFKNDTLNGHFIEYSTDGKKMREGETTKGWYTGVWKEWKNDVLVNEGAYIDGRKHGVWRSYFDNGPLDTETMWVNGTQHGAAKKYYSNGQVFEDYYYKDGELDSSYVSYHPDGKIKARGTFGKNVKQGEWKWWFENGNPSTVNHFIDGVENGWLLNYWVNGKLRAEAERRNDVMYGSAKFYATTGVLYEVGSYVDGKFDGKWIFYDSLTGRLESISYFSKGKRNGTSETYDVNGKITDKRYWLNGWEETVTNIQDSIEHLLRVRDFDNALKAVKWMQAIEKREYKKSTDRILSISVTGRIYSTMRNHEKAYEYFLKYLKAVDKQQGKQNVEYKTALHNVATAMHAMRKYDEALKYYDAAIEIAKPLGLVKAYWSTIINKAYCLFDAGRQEQAFALLDEEIQKANTAYGEHSASTWYLRYETADFYYDRVEDFKKSAVMFEELVADIEKANEKDNIYWFDANRKLAELRYYKFDDNDGAKAPYYDAIAYAEKHGLADSPQYGSMLSDLFYIYNTHNVLDTLQAKEARKMSEKMQKFVVECPDPFSRGEAYLAMGNDVYNREEYPQAFQYFSQAEENFIRAGYENTTRHAAVLQSLAFSLYYSDRLRADEAEKYFMHAIGIKKQKLDSTSHSFYNSLYQLSEFYSMLERYDVAASMMRRVKKIAISVNDQVMIARSNQKLGESAYNRWHYSEAIPLLKEAVEFYEKRPTDFPDPLLNTISYIAQSYKYRGDYEEAIAWAKRNIDLTKKMFGEKHPYYFTRLASLAIIYDYANRYTEALKIYSEAAAGLSSIEGPASYSTINQQINIVDLRIKMIDYKRAIEQGENLLTVIKNSHGENSDLYLSLVAMVGNAYDNANDFPKAEERFVKAVEISRSLNGRQSPSTATQLSRLGRFYERRNRLEEAQSTLQEAVDIMRASDYRNAIAIAPYLGYLGTVLQDLDKNKEAEELYNEAFAIASQDTLNNVSSYVEAGQELSRFYAKVGRFKDAGKMIGRLTRLIASTEGKGLYYAQTRHDVVYMYYRLGEYEEAIKEAQELLAILEERVGPDHWLVLRLHNYLGIIYDDQSEFEKARKEFIFCIDASERKKVLTENEQASLATFYSNVARIDLCLGNYESAGKFLDKTDRLRKEYKITIGQANYAATMANKASYFQAINKMDKAEATWAELNKSLLDFSRNNFYFMTDEEKAQFWKSYNGYFQIFQAFAAYRSKQNPAIISEMYNVQLATKAILLSASNKIRKRILSSRDTSMVNMYYQWTRKREQLAQLYSSGAANPKQRLTIDSLETSARLLEKEMNISAEDVSKDKGGETITWKNVQSVLGPDEAAIEIVRFKHYDRFWRDSVIYAAMVLTSETRQYPKFVVLNDGKLLEGRYLKYYRNAIAGRVVDTLSYRQYWGALDKVIKGKSRVYLSLDGVYNQINLNTLMDPAGGFLVDDKNLTILSNTKDLLAIKSRKARRISLSSATLFGFPTYFLGGNNGSAKGTTRDIDRTGISPLAGTKEEIQKVGSILNSHKIHADVYTNEDASEHSIKQLAHPRVLHIATHGFFVEDNDNVLATATGTDNNPLLRAGLLLAGAANFIQDQSRVDEENGILTAYEAANLDLDNTDLVVLSACETGKGEVQNGEGVYGLQRAFQTAGAQTIVMSLWKVDDAATQQLMTSFYSNWMEGMNKAEALKKAQISLKKQFPHPYYWGAFVMLEN